MDPDGTPQLFEQLDGRPETYKAHAEYNHEVPVSLRAAAHVFAHRPLTAAVVSELNREVSLAILPMT